jgi:hypothetical protein
MALSLSSYHVFSMPDLGVLKPNGSFSRLRRTQRSFSGLRMHHRRDRVITHRTKGLRKLNAFVYATCCDACLVGVHGDMCVCTHGHTHVDGARNLNQRVLKTPQNCWLKTEV